MLVSGDPSVSESWLSWLQKDHIEKVCDGGAIGASIVHVSDDPPTYEIHYRFPSSSAFETYEKVHAPGLREEGLQEFPLSMGLNYERSVSEIVWEHTD